MYSSHRGVRPAVRGLWPCHEGPDARPGNRLISPLAAVRLSPTGEFWFWHGFRDGPWRRVTGPVVDHGRGVLILIWFGFCGRI
ncbi:hypothetical protein [Kibdelosporangium philippinense]|uniref:hypothetical protein n=1 Tax=Kibdelosporangium philippinense TaxID=211113 RepID=UPI00362023AC